MTTPEDDLDAATRRMRDAFRLAAPAIHGLFVAFTELTVVAARQLRPLLEREERDRAAR